MICRFDVTVSDVNIILFISSGSSGNDEFADFSSAFSGGVTSSSSTVGGSSQQFSSGTISSHTTVLSNNGNSGKNYPDLS
jgi:hypothetical protein